MRCARCALFRRNAAITLCALQVRPRMTSRNQSNYFMFCSYHTQEEVNKPRTVGRKFNGAGRGRQCPPRSEHRKLN